MKELKGANVRDGYVQKETTRSLAQERDRWQRKREAHVVAIEREREESTPS